MEVKVEIGLTRELSDIANRLIAVLDKSMVVNSEEIKGNTLSKKVDTAVAVEEVSDVGMAENVSAEEKVDLSKEFDAAIETAEAEEEDPPFNDVPDYATLRKEIRSLGVKLAREKKGAKVKKLLEEYGCKKLTDIPDGAVVKCLEQLKELDNG